jgi:hypothetical protein
MMAARLTIRFGVDLRRASRPIVLTNTNDSAAGCGLNGRWGSDNGAIEILACGAGGRMIGGTPKIGGGAVGGGI